MTRLPRMNFQEYKPVILLTGCGSGLGLTLANVLYHLGQYRVVLTAREKSLDLLKEKFTESSRVLIRELDVTCEHSRIALINEINKTWGAVDVLINNAGISYRTVVEHMSDQDEQIQMATNYLGPMGLIRLVLPRMRKKGRGKIINISSVSGMLSMPTMASYSASKHALEGASEALWHEMKPFGISVSLIQPGFIHSNSFQNVYFSTGAKAAIESAGPYSDFYASMGPFIKSFMNKSLYGTEEVAHRIVEVIQMQNPPLRVPCTPDAHLFSLAKKFIPEKLLLQLLYFFLPNSLKWGKLYTAKRPRFATQRLQKLLK